MFIRDLVNNQKIGNTSTLIKIFFIKNIYNKCNDDMIKLQNSNN